jgi:hypothetical protein
MIYCLRTNAVLLLQRDHYKSLIEEDGNGWFQKGNSYKWFLLIPSFLGKNKRIYFLLDMGYKLLKNG